MADLDIYFEAAIPPKAKGRPRTAAVNGHARVFTPAETRRWEQDFAAIAARHAPGQVIDVPTRVDVLAVMPRPKRLLRARDAEGLVWCESRPDADNIRKAVLDAMAAWWRDDALVVSGQTIKAHAEKTGLPRVIVRVRTLTTVDPMTVVGPVFGLALAGGETGPRQLAIGGSP